MANLIADLKAILRLSVDTSEAKKAENTVTSFYDHLKRAKDTLKAGTFQGAEDDIKKINARFQDSQKRIQEITTKLVAGRGMLSLMGDDQARMNSLMSAYVALLRQTTSVRAATGMRDSNGSTLGTPSAGADTLNASPKTKAFQGEVESIQASFREFIAQTQAAGTQAAAVANTTATESANTRVQAEQKVATETVKSAEVAGAGQKDAAKAAMDSVAEILQAYGKDAGAVAEAAGLAIADQQKKIAGATADETTSRNQLAKQLQHEQDIRRQLAQANAEGNEAAVRVLRAQLNSELDVRYSIQKNLDAQTQYKASINDNIASLKKLRDNAKMAPLNEASAQLAQYKTQIAAANNQLNQQATVIQQLQAAQQRYIAQLNATNAAMQRLQQTQTRTQNNNQLSTLTQQMRNFQSAAVIAAGPLSGLGSRVTAFGGLVARAGFETALLTTSLVGLAAGTVFAIKEAIEFRKKFEASIEMLDRTRASTDSLGEGFKFVSQIATQFGFNMIEVIKPIAKLRAALQGTTLAPQFKEISRDILAIGSAFRLSSEELGRMTKALEQMLSKGVVQAEELRGQLGDVLPASARVALEAFREMTKNPIASMRDFTDAMKTSSVESDKFMTVFLAKYKEFFSIDASKTTESLNGAFAQLSNTFVSFVLDMDKTFNITNNVIDGLRSLSSIVQVVSENMDVFRAVIRTVYAATIALIGLRVAQYFMAFHAATVAATASGLAAAATWTAMASALGMVFGALLVLEGARATWVTIFGDGSEAAAKAAKAAKEYGAALKDVQEASQGNLFTFKSNSTDIKAFQLEVANFIKEANSKLATGVVLKPSLDIEGSLNDVIAQMRVKSTALNEEVARSLGKTTALTVDKLREVAKQTGELGRKAFESVDLTNQATQLQNLRAEYIKTNVAQQAIVNTQNSASATISAFATVLGFLRDNVSALIGVGGALVVTVRAITTGLIGCRAAAAATAGTWSVAATAASRLGFAALAAGAALAYFVTKAKASDISDSLAPAIGKVQEYIDTFNQTGKTNLGALKNTQEVVRNEISRVSDELKTAQDELVKYNTTLSRTVGKGFSLNNLTEGVGASVNKDGLEEKIKALQESLVKLRTMGSEVNTIAAIIEKEMGEAFKGLAGDKQNDALSEFEEKMSALRRQVGALSGTRAVAAEVTAKYAAEEREVAKSLLNTGLATSDAKAKLEEYMGLYKQKMQLESGNKLDDILKTAADQATAARDGLLDQFNAQKKVNDEVERARNLAIEAGLSQDQINQKMGAYRTNLEAIDAAQKKATTSTKSLEFGFQKYKTLIQDLRKPLDSLADSIGDLASKGELSFRSFSEAVTSMLRGLIKETVAYILKISLIKPMLDGLTSSVGSGGGGLQSALTMMMGGNVGIGEFASGGVIDRPTFFGHGGGLGLAGEAGSEAIMPLSRGPGGRLGVSMHGESSRPVNVTFNVSTPNPDAFRKSEGQMAAMAARVVGRGQRNL